MLRVDGRPDRPEAGSAIRQMAIKAAPPKQRCRIDIVIQKPAHLRPQHGPQPQHPKRLEILIGLMIARDQAGGQGISQPARCPAGQPARRHDPYGRIVTNRQAMGANPAGEGAVLGTRHDRQATRQVPGTGSHRQTGTGNQAMAGPGIMRIRIQPGRKFGRMMAPARLKPVAPGYLRRQAIELGRIEGDLSTDQGSAAAQSSKIGDDPAGVRPTVSIGGEQSSILPEPRPR